MKSYIREIIDKQLKERIKLLCGPLLDLGGGMGPYKDLLPLNHFSIDLSIYADIRADLMYLPIKSNCINSILCTEVLEHIPEPSQIISEIDRVLIKSGVLILTTRFVCQFHPDPHDYYRYTKDGLEYLLRKFEIINITPQGGFFLILGDFLREVLSNRIKILAPLARCILQLDKTFKTACWTSGYCVIAKKYK